MEVLARAKIREESSGMTEKRRVGITDTTLRDAHQSLMATRMQLKHMLGVAEMMDEVGFHSMEVWGGATFDSCLRFLDEDPWERLRTLRSIIKKTKLQMLLRGQNLVGYRHYSDDVVDAFVRKSVSYGMDVFRIFDALNDTRNMARAMGAARKEGAHVQATICYTLSPVHNTEYFVAMGRQLVEMGADSIAIKDMAGMLAPYDSFELVSRLKELGVPIQLHCHYTGGMASMSYLKAVEAGIDVLDTACSPLAMGTSQPPTESIVATLKGTAYGTGLNLELLSDISEHVKEIRKHYHIPLDIALGVDTNVLNYQIPGGMMSNLVSQLEQQKATHLLPEVLKEVPRVREDLGYPPLVTPTSQIVGSQAVVNVLLGERYKMISTEVKNYVRGMYGRPPAPLNKELQLKVLGDEAPVDIRPADLLEPQMELLACDLAESDDDLISFAILPQVAETFFKRRRGEEAPIPDEEKGGFPAKPKPKKEQKQETDFGQLYTVDRALLLDDQEDLIAYPAF